MSSDEFSTVNDNAQALYGAGEAELLLRVWNQIPAAERKKYAKLAFRVAQVHADEGRHDEARLILRLCQDYCEEQDYTPGLGSVFLEHARLAFQENDLAQVQYFIERLRAVSSLEVHLGEGETTLGKAFQEIDPAQALAHFEKARHYFLKAQVDIPACKGDVARTSLRAGSLAIRLRLFDKGWRYLQEAETYLRSLGDPQLLSKTLVRMGEAHAIQGNYPAALTCLREAVELAQNSPQQDMEAKAYLSALLVLMNNQEQARTYLREVEYSGHTETVVYRLIAEVWISLFDLKLAHARQLLKRIASLQGDNAVVARRISLLEGFMAAQEGAPAEAGLETLRQAIAFFEDHNLLIEASQGRLILAWCYMLNANPVAAKEHLTALEELIEIIGHAKHLSRLYDLCAPLLGGWLTKIGRDTLENSLVEMPQATGYQQVRIYAFGIPRVFVGTKEYPKHDNSSFIGIKLLLWMLEKRHAPMEEVIDALWPNLTLERGRERFYQTTTNLKRRQNLVDWYEYDNLNKLYRLKKQFPHYYDGEDFKQTYERFKRSNSPTQQFVFGWKLVNLYEVFAKGVDEESFQVIRLEYEARFDLVRLKMQAIAPSIMTILPQEWSQALHDKVLLYTS